MYNDLVFIVPKDDPAKIRNADNALKAIAASGQLFVSRGDKSGTYAAELRLWKKAGIDPKGLPGYKETSSGMGPTLNMAAAERFAGWPTSPAGQEAIASFRADGQQAPIPSSCRKSRGSKRMRHSFSPARARVRTSAAPVRIWHAAPSPWRPANALARPNSG
jgi:ABC-type tungstate transport system permease subunit